MGSTFVTLDPSKSDTKRLFNSKKPQDIWLQFVPGIVGDVITSTDSKLFITDAEGFSRVEPSRKLINSILAKPHIGNNLKKTGLLDEDDRYYPMFRGIVDVPMIGDPVLLCTIGGVQYYLGPLNTVGVPGYNLDHLETSDIRGVFSKIPVTEKDMVGISKNWLSREGVVRLEKLSNLELDDPDGIRTTFKHSETSKDILGDTHGDLMFEGRHGNSIRIGSRNINPYIIISNNNAGASETTDAGSILAMLDRGTIRQHFSNNFKEFILASDDSEVNDSIRKIGSDLYNYDFGLTNTNTENQIIQNSDKITLNSRADSIFLSSYKNVVIGTGDSLIVRSKNHIIFDSYNIYLGKAYDDNTSYPMESLVLGDELVTVLEKMIDAIGKLQVAATIGGTSAPVMGSGSTGWMDMMGIKSNLSSILSKYHFIEKNNTQK